MKHFSEMSGSSFQPNAPFPAFPGEGLMSGLMSATDWTKTPLGSPESWSPALRMMTKFLLANRFPQLLWWGPQFCSLYNDAYVPILGMKHPWALGRPVREVWGEIWPVLKPLIETPFHGGPATWMEDLPLEINRRGFFEETHFTIAYSPVPDESVPNGIGGVLATVHEITDKVIGERRVQALRELGAHSTEPKSAEEACELLGKTLSAYAKDIPFLLLYLLDERQQTASRTCTAGVDPEDRGCPKSINLTAKTDPVWPLSAARATGRIQLIENVKDKFDMPPQGPWSQEPEMAAVVPIRSNLPHQLSGFLVAGLSSHIPFDGRYRDFLELMSTQITTTIENARVFEERRVQEERLLRSEKLAATGRLAATIAHEINNPLESVLNLIYLARISKDQTEKVEEFLSTAESEMTRVSEIARHTLGFYRESSVPAQIDVQALLEEVLTVYHSRLRAAGLEVRRHFAAVPTIKALRGEMHQVFSNLLSNAIDATRDGGRLSVALRKSERDGTTGVEVRIEDNGTGIPPENLPRLFEAFFTTKRNAGTGLGLWVVKQFVESNGGSIRVTSSTESDSHGTTFRIFLPLIAVSQSHQQNGSAEAA